MSELPARIPDTATLEDLLSEPTPAVVQTLRQFPGDIVVLGAGGKMGPSLTRMLRRAADWAETPRRVIAVSRFTDASLIERLRRQGVEVVCCDLLARNHLDQLPEAALVFYLVGVKFGTTGNEWRTWASNAYLPALVAERYRQARWVIFSTGNVYGLVPVVSGGSCETDALRPDGEYAASAVARERIFEFFSRRDHMAMTILRLNYAQELRYGVLVDIARAVWEGRPIPLAMGCFNALWQGDALAWAIQSLAYAEVPPRVLNLAGPETVSVRWAAEQFARRFKKPPHLVGSEAPDAYLSNAAQAHRLFGYPRVPVGLLVEWIADWILNGNELWEKPTHFEVRSGQF
ncbi:MAG: NAD-dependent epimerase/dehydratase family protein [Gemmatales bacterium]|nr:NAD-dependent epimerase/dehydratase family protein [Gemmatales bacterium]MDW7993399.1 NAD-dependent epimerase/dehydratase family protein [Gemmatales bacterium]